MSYIILRCPNCLNTLRRDHRRNKLRCNFCSGRYNADEGIPSERKTARGPIGQYQRPKREGSGVIAGPIVIGRRMMQRW